MKNDSWWRLLRKGKWPKRLETSKRLAGEAQSNGQQGVE